MVHYTVYSVPLANRHTKSAKSPSIYGMEAV